jgi:two-component system, cell cycle sensor histidine kinase DivJ
MPALNAATPIRDYLDGLVHPSARADALMAVRHRVFMAPRLFGSLIALAIMPVFLALRGVPTLLEFIVLAWMIVPVAIAYFLSRTGRFESAHVISALSLATIVTVVAATSGGINSFAAIWLVLIPLEAAASGSRRVVAVAALLTLGAAAFLMATGTRFSAAAAEQQSDTLAALGIVSAALYATGIALGADAVARTNSWLLGIEEERCRLLAGNMSDVIARVRENGRVLFVSPNAEAVLGTSAADLMGHGLFERIHIADRPAYLTALARGASAGEACEVEFRLRRTPPTAEAGHFIWIEILCRPFGDRAAGAASEMVAVLRDVTVRKAQQQALIEARAEAERANAAKSRFLAVMSHELRTPLNAIIGFSDMLRNETQMQVDRDRRQEYARLINESGYHLLAVVNDILDMSRLETGDFEITSEPFKLGAVMVSCHELLALKAQDAGVALICNAAAGLPDIVADKRAVKQILINLISNAIKFTDRGGTVTVSADVEGQHILLSVSDNGIGIAPDDLSRIGAPFFQARGSYSRPHDGSGLGLSIVKGLVKLHGGDFEIRSRPGEGTVIVVRLPLDCEQVAAPRRAIALQRSLDLAPSAAIPAKQTHIRLEEAIQRRA